MFAGSMVAIVVAAIAFGIFLPSYVLLATQLRENQQVATSTSISAAQQAQDNAQLKHVNGLLQLFGPALAASSSPADVIATVLAMRPAGVRVDQVIYTAGNPTSLIVNGSADTNIEISDYRSLLATYPTFTSVSVPVGALVGTDGGRFSLTIFGKF